VIIAIVLSGARLIHDVEYTGPRGFRMRRLPDIEPAANLDGLDLASPVDAAGLIVASCMSPYVERSLIVGGAS
jgi:hypothetical protein